MDITVVLLDGAGNELFRAVVGVGAPTTEAVVEEVPPVEEEEVVAIPVEEEVAVAEVVESVPEEPAAPAAE